MIGVIVLATAVAAGLVAVGPSAEDLPVADFNHAIHIARDLECVDCHTGVETRAAAGVPSITICAECHDDPEDSMIKTANGKRISDHIQRGEELWWPSVYDLPDHVVFSHRRHFALGRIACKECHGDVAGATTLPVALVESTLTMDGCMDCHARNRADQDCFACHK